MPSFETLLPFFGIAVVLGLTPGPDNVFVLLQSAMRGPRAGMVVVLGLCTGLLVHTAAVALGLAALFAASKLAFMLLKIAGANLHGRQLAPVSLAFAFQIATAGLLVFDRCFGGRNAFSLLGAAGLDRGSG